MLSNECPHVRSGVQCCIFSANLYYIDWDKVWRFSLDLYIEDTPKLDDTYKHPQILHNVKHMLIIEKTFRNDASIDIEKDSFRNNEVSVTRQIWIALRVISEHMGYGFKSNTS